MFLKSDGILVKFPFFQGNVGNFFVSALSSYVEQLKPDNRTEMKSQRHDILIACF